MSIVHVLFIVVNEKSAFVDSVEKTNAWKPLCRNPPV